ncbi:hypothetical protein BD311DRAFT_855410 [Dichomitus squalens]|uniref:BTB domain-containing protein n=1 Tax=Dichomitus squalens TaxID=114155 RepID=A0A4Q9MEG1_9APHY|nr:hypothetical protein BD311DRAFT_855410 [Dichomitus squalens]
MSSRVTRKRARTEEEPAEQQMHGVNMDVDSLSPSDPGPTMSALKRDGEFWFDDGTVILLAADVEFRVYNRILSGHSPVFQDISVQDHPLRAVCIDETQNITCSVVELSDSPEDLRHVLRAYMPREDASLSGKGPPTFAQLSASVRLGKKSEIPQLYEQSLAVLKQYFTDDFWTWRSQRIWVPERFYTVEAIGVVNLARLTGEMSILPTALVSCLVLGSDIVDGFEREDGFKENLTLEDLDLCIRAQAEIRKASVGSVFRRFKPTVSAGCKTAESCGAAFRKMLYGLEQRMEILISGNPLAEYTAYLGGENIGLCAYCLEMLEDRDDKERTDIWKRLPDLLGIEVPGWGEAATVQPEDRETLHPERYRCLLGYSVTTPSAEARKQVSIDNASMR